MRVFFDTESKSSTLVENVPNNGRYQWHRPAGSASSADCRLRYTLDAAGQPTAVTPQPFIIVGSAYELGDLDCSGTVDVNDISPFVLGLTDPVGYTSEYPNCNIDLADLNRDRSEDGADIQAFVDAVLPGN